MSKRIDDIEILRAVAIIYVLIEHAQINLLHWNSPAIERVYAWFGGWSGVDLFFVISGFVITRELEPRLRTAANPLEFFNRSIAFWLRRCWRLIPSAWLWLGIVLVVGVVFNQSGAFAPFRTNFSGAVASVLQVQNLHMAAVIGQGQTPSNFLYWSLSLEEQFYLALPFVILCSGRFLPQTLAVIALWQIFTPRIAPLQYMLRTDALALGALLALWQQKPSYRLFEPHFLVKNLVKSQVKSPAKSLVKSLASRLLRVGVIALLLTGLAVVGAKVMQTLSLRVGIIALISFTLVLIASYDRNVFLGDGIAKRIALWVGSRSYALYLTHIPAYLLTREIWWRLSPADTRFGPAFSLQFIATATVLLIILSELNFRLVETPLRRRGKEIAQNIEQRPVPTLEISRNAS